SRVALRRHANDAVALLRELTDVLFNPAEIIQDTDGALEHAASRGCQDHAFANAEKEWGVESRLDVAQLMTERRLGQVQAQRRPRHAPRFRDAGDQSQMTNFEIHGPPRMRITHTKSVDHEQVPQGSTGFYKVRSGARTNPAKPCRTRQNPEEPLEL